MNTNKQLLIKFLSIMTGEDLTSVKKTLKGVTTEEEHDNDIQLYTFNNSYIAVSEINDLAIILNLKDGDNDTKRCYILQLSPYATFYKDGRGPYQTQFYDFSDDYENAHELAEAFDKLLNCSLFEKLDRWESYTILSTLLNECSLDYCAENCDNFYIEDTETLFNDFYCVPENISSYIDYERFERDLTFDNFISLGGRVLYYGC